MANLILYITGGLFLSFILFVCLIIWDRNRISASFPTDTSGLANRRQFDNNFTPRRVFDGSHDDYD